MESHCDLDQSLKKLFVFRRGGAPDVFKVFVSVKEFGLIERGNSLQIFFGIHSSFWHSAQADIATRHRKLCLYELATARKCRSAN